MASNPTPNSRAALLSGLRTGGVRSVSGPVGNVPHTAAPAGTFNIPRYSPPMHGGAFPEEEDELADMVPQNVYMHNNGNHMQHPMTAAVDGAVNRFAQQQMMNMNGGGFMDPQAQMQALQLQMMQMEIARLQVRSGRSSHSQRNNNV